MEDIESQVPKFDEMFEPVIQALNNLNGSATNSELVEEVANILSLSDEVREFRREKDNFRSLYEYNLAWTRTYLKKAQIIDNSTRGVWTLTTIGGNIQSADKDEIKRMVRAQTPPAEKKVDEEEEGEGPEPEDLWKENLREILLNMDPYAFEKLCARLLREAGFVEVDVTRRSGDGGIDGNGILQHGLIGWRVVFQSKRYHGSVSPEQIQAFRGAVQGRADRGLFITTGTFTANARKEATRQGGLPIDLIDGNKLIDLLKEYQLGISVELRTVEIITVDEQWFETK